MRKKIIIYVQGLAFIPMLTVSSPFLALYQQLTAVSQNEVIDISLSINRERAEKIDAYFAQRDMPLEGYGAKMIEEAEKNDIDWRLIPAIAIRESSGGKFAYRNNPFGWASCKIGFRDFNHSIEVVAHNLGGNNPATARYYNGTTTEEKLYHYNGSVIPAYTGEVLQFMRLISRQTILETDIKSV
ncbi:hypothetical protein ACFL05_00075 [Patescibacteria group bacterium]